MAQLHPLTLLDGGVHGSCAGSLHTDDLAGGIEHLNGHGDTADQTAAADGHNNLGCIRQLLQDLQADGALAGDHIGIVKGVSKGVTLFFGKTLSFPGCIVINTGNQNHFCAIALSSFHLADGGAGRHANNRLNAQLGGRERHTLGMVTGRACDHAPGGFFRCQRPDLVVGTPELKCAGQLQVFCFDVHICAKLGSGVQRGSPGDSVQRFLCILDHIKCQHR